MFCKSVDVKRHLCVLHEQRLFQEEEIVSCLVRN